MLSRALASGRPEYASKGLDGVHQRTAVKRPLSTWEVWTGEAILDFEGKRLVSTVGIGASPRDARRLRWLLTDALHQVEVGESASVLVDVGAGVGRDEDRSHVGDAGHIRRHQGLPGLALSCGQIQAVNLGGKVARVIHKNRF